MLTRSKQAEGGEHLGSVDEYETRNTEVKA